MLLLGLLAFVAGLWDVDFSVLAATAEFCLDDGEFLIRRLVLHDQSVSHAPEFSLALELGFTVHVLDLIVFDKGKGLLLHLVSFHLWQRFSMNAVFFFHASIS